MVVFGRKSCLRSVGPVIERSERANLIKRGACVCSPKSKLKNRVHHIRINTQRVRRSCRCWSHWCAGFRRVHQASRRREMKSIEKLLLNGSIQLVHFAVESVWRFLQRMRGPLRYVLLSRSFPGFLGFPEKKSGGQPSLASTFADTKRNGPKQNSSARRLLAGLTVVYIFNFCV